MHQQGNAPGHLSALDLARLQLVVLRQRLHRNAPGGTILPVYILAGANLGVVVEATCGNDDGAAALRFPRQRRAAAFAETGGKMLCLGVFETPDLVGAIEPLELFGRDKNVARMRTAGELAAARTVAVLKHVLGSVKLVADAAAQATTSISRDRAFSRTCDQVNPVSACILMFNRSLSSLT